MTRRAFISTDSREAGLFSLINESDKGCAIIVGSLLENTLRNIHKANISTIVSEGKCFYESLFSNPYSPLATFSGLIQIGYAYGLVSVEDYKDLCLFKRIRNEAAHSLLEFSFEDRGVKSLVMRLTAQSRAKPQSSSEWPPQEEQATQEPDKTLPKVSEVRLCFLNGFLGLDFMLEKVIESINKRRGRGR